MNLREVLEMVRIGYPIVVHSESLAITDRKTLNVRPQDAQTCLQVPRIALERSICRFQKRIYPGPTFFKIIRRNWRTRSIPLNRLGL